MIGDGIVEGSYEPDSTRAGAGRIRIGGGTITFYRLEPIEIHDLSQYNFQTTGSQDVLTIDSSSSGRNRILGTSNGTSFESVTFYNIQDLIIDTTTNDGASPNDSIIINSRLIASGLKNLTILTGAGDDKLTIHTDNFSLPSSSGAFVFNGGTGNETIDFDTSSGGYTETFEKSLFGFHLNPPKTIYP